MRGFSTNADLLAHVVENGHGYRTLGRAPDGSPIVAVEGGGDAEPGVLVTAGAHATEHAGVRAAVEILDAVETHRRVVVVPTRDPVGLNGYTYALETALGETLVVESYDGLADLLRTEADVVVDDDEMLLGLVGDVGFATREPTDGRPSCLSLMSALKDHAAAGTPFLERFRGRRVYAPAGFPTVEETGDFDRAFTFVISPAGEFMHLNRFFDRSWAPVETRCVRDLMDELEPVLTVDLHESSRQGPRYHISLRPQATDDRREREARVASAAVDAVSAAGVTLATDDDIFGSSLDVVGHGTDGDDEHRSDPNDPFYRRAERGAYWVDPNATAPPRRGEGLNAVDYAAETHGLAYTTETGIHAPFADRVHAAVVSVQAVVDELAEHDRE